MFSGCIPTILCDELDVACQDAPDASQVDRSCSFWMSFLTSFTRGDLVSLARSVYRDLSEMSDEEEAKFAAYRRLEASLDETERIISQVSRHALDTDPSGRSTEYYHAKHSEKKIQHISEVIGELIIFRRDSLECLQQMAVLEGCLVYKVV